MFLLDRALNWIWKRKMTEAVYRNEFHRFEQQARFAEIEIIDGCNAKCVCCPRGMGLIPTTMKTMNIILYTNIIKKCVEYGVKGVALFNWSEPFLNRNVSEYCEIAKAHNLYVCLSSNLSLKNINLEETLAYVDNIEISVSGFSQEIYEINHRGLDINTVKNNLKMIEELLQKQKIHTNVYLKLFDYEYNKQDLKQWNSFLAKDTKINIMIVKGNCDPVQNNKEIQLGDVPKEYFGKMYNKEKLLYRNDIPMVYCNCVKKFCIDVNGKLQLCSEKIYNEDIIIGDFLQDDICKMQELKIKHMECKCCDVMKRQCNILRKKELTELNHHNFY